MVQPFSARLLVNNQDMSPRFGKGTDIFPRLFDHEMHIQRKRRSSPACFHDNRSESQVWDEVTVHDIHMYPISTPRFSLLYLFRQPAEIRRKDGWSQEAGRQAVVHGPDPLRR